MNMQIAKLLFNSSVKFVLNNLNIGAIGIVICFMLMMRIITKISTLQKSLKDNSRKTINAQSKTMDHYHNTYNNLMKKNNLLISQIKKLFQDNQTKSSELDKSLFVATSNFSRLRDSIKDIQSTTNAISQYFEKPDTKGNFGEYTLEDILSKSGLVKNRDFFIQRLFNRQQPDASVLLNGKFYHIDAKTSLPKKTQSTLEWLKALKDKYRKQIKLLSSANYASIKNSAPIVILFIPSDALLINLINADSQIIHNAYNNSIILASPTSLGYIIQILQHLTPKAKESNTYCNRSEAIDLSDY